MKKDDDDKKYKENLKKKAWRDLDSNTKLCILNDSTKYANVTPKQEPYDSFLSILAKNHQP